MSILIKGMGMPKRCLECDFDDEWGNCICMSKEPYECNYEIKQRPDWCPLEEVPETHDKRTETHACDLIDRQALCEYALNQKDKSVTPNDIMRFPSADLQPTCNQLATDSNTHKALDALDCIDRQAAIDAIRNIREVYVNNLPTLIDKASVQTELMMLPSAQPTLYGYNIEHLAYIARVMEKEGITAEVACPNCGADMRGEE